MAFAHTLMVFILIVSFGLLAAVFTFWMASGKLVQDNPKEKDTLDSGNWDATTLLLR